MPVRKIGLSWCSLTAIINDDKYSDGPEAESGLENDFYKIASFDFDVATVEAQPLKIDTIADQNERIIHFLDAMINFKLKSRPLLVEIKYIDELARNSSLYQNKFAATKEFAINKNMDFKVLSEVDIRIPYLQNVRIFRKRRNFISDTRSEDLVREFLKNGPLTVAKLTQMLCKSGVQSDQATRSLYRMISNGSVRCDFMKQFTKMTLLYLENKKIFDGFFASLDKSTLSKKAEDSLKGLGIHYKL